MNTLVFDDGRVVGHSTDAAVLAGLTAERPVILGDGGAADAFRAALPQARCSLAAATGRPIVGDADLVVNATSERAEVLVELVPGRRSSTSRIRTTATGQAARESGAQVVDGLEVLVAQGAASFELWTGLPAPVDVMRRAVGLSA